MISVFNVINLADVSIKLIYLFALFARMISGNQLNVKSEPKRMTIIEGESLNYEPDEESVSLAYRPTLYLGWIFSSCFDVTATT